jgi:hypothetical protein
MTFAERLLATLPPFLRPRLSGPTEDYVGAIGAGLEAARDEIRLLRARGAARRFAGEFAEYYASDQRKDDVARIGAARLLSKRANETWLQFEERVRDFSGLEVWDGSKQRYTVTGDVALWGCFSGITRELERTGLQVASIYSGMDLGDAWKVYDFEHIEEIPQLLRSKMYAIGEEIPEGQHVTKVYDLDWLAWTFYVTLAYPGPQIPYSLDELKEILKLTKPAWTRAMLKEPMATEWIEVI